MNSNEGMKALIFLMFLLTASCHSPVHMVQESCFEKYSNFEDVFYCVKPRLLSQYGEGTRAYRKSQAYIEIYLAQGEKILRKVDNGDITDSEALSS